jgi:putative Mg2+ transporter-C (MgtC) family protein
LKGEKDMTFWDVLARLLIAALCGGIIGIERGKKNRAAGFRTYILVCVGAALTMVLSAYVFEMEKVWRESAANFPKTDLSRFGAQVINGIGFLGAGTIIVTGRQQVKGMTTAAGLWASACMGLAIGAGFYEGALVGCVLIFLTIVLFTKIESFILSHSKNINLYIEFEDTEDLSRIISKIKENDVRIFDVEITKGKYSETKFPNAIFSLRLPKKLSHSALVTAIATVENVRMIEEL